MVVPSDAAARRAEGTAAKKLTTITVCPLPGEPVAGLCRRLAHRLQELEATPLQILAFGRCAVSAATREALQQALGRVDWPITWVEGEGCGSEPLAGLQVHAFSGEVERVIFQGRPVGSVFLDGGAKQCIVGELLPAYPSASRASQTAQVLEDMQNVLALAGFHLSDVVRTWFYLDNILAWYDEFNPVRTKIYSGVKFRTGSLPASTGIGARNPAGAALALAAWAFSPRAADAYAEEVASPRQCPAPAYGSSFSRALETSSNGGRRLFISGTASIAPGGQTVWPEDVPRQVNLTMEVVAAILEARRFTLADLTRVTAYFRRAKDARAFTEWLAARRLAHLPVVATHCDVCRDDLLFELEGEAESGK